MSDKHFLNIFNSKKPFVLFDSNVDNYSKIFYKFDKILTFSTKNKYSFDDYLKKIDNLINKNYFAAGFLNYETGYLLEPTLNTKYIKDETLAWFGISKNIIECNLNPFFKELKTNSFYNISNIKPTETKKTYIKNIEKIKTHILEGRTYQVNYTFKLKFDFKGNILRLYKDLREKQPTKYSFLIYTGSEYILSLSPELFYEINGKKIQTKPMKGTFKRGKTFKEDLYNKKFLKNDIKNQAENIMIVDLLRNDIGKISKNVKVTKLFKIEKYPSLFQMTSTIKAKLSKNINFSDIIQAIYPCGSVTGAPKIETMKIIQKLEKAPRNIYTGSIGYISPKNNDSIFNVAIRTIKINKIKSEMGIGSGIVFDSIPSKEYEESLLKAKFLKDLESNFEIITTLLWNKKYYLLKAHLQRLKTSTTFFKFPFNEAKIKLILKQISKNFIEPKYKIRILLNKNGRIKVSFTVLKPSHTNPKIIFSDTKTNASNIFLYHKTTNRKIYSEELQNAIKKGYFEIIFQNKSEEITEGSFTNFFIEKKGKLYTPPVNSGLLNGIYRKKLLKSKKAFEKIIFKKDVMEADRIFVGNSLRGLIEVKL